LKPSSHNTKEQSFNDLQDIAWRLNAPSACTKIAVLGTPSNEDKSFALKMWKKLFGSWAG